MSGYVTPPVFSDGSVLSATQLNALSGNQEYLYEQATRVNVPSPIMSLQVGSGEDGEILRVIRHKFKTLELKNKIQWDIPTDKTILLMDNKKKDDLKEFGGVEGLAKR